MIIRREINGSQVRILPVEYNGGRVYVRINVQKTEDGWKYDEYEFMSNEYEAVKGGSLPSGAVWDDVLRSIERRSMYSIIDEQIAKYRDDVADPVKMQHWIDLKRQVRATTQQATYPTTVVYPVLE